MNSPICVTPMTLFLCAMAAGIIHDVLRGGPRGVVAQSPAVTIAVKYSCVGCGLVRAEAVVPAREEEGVVEWVEQTIRRVAADHARRSSWCVGILTDLMIPITGVEKIGGPPIQ